MAALEHCPNNGRFFGLLCSLLSSEDPARQCFPWWSSSARDRAQEAQHARGRCLSQEVITPSLGPTPWSPCEYRARRQCCSMEGSSMARRSRWRHTRPCRVLHASSASGTPPPCRGHFSRVEAQDAGDRERASLWRTLSQGHRHVG